MKKLSFRNVMFSTLAGVALALIVVLSAVGFTQRAFADEVGNYCKPPAGCNTLEAVLKVLVDYVEWKI